MNNYNYYFTLTLEKFNLIFFKNKKLTTTKNIILLKRLIINKDLFLGKIKYVNIFNINIFFILFRKICYLLIKLINKKCTIYFLKTSNNYINIILKEIIFEKRYYYKFLFIFLNLKKKPIKLKLQNISKKKKIIQYLYCPEAVILFDYIYNFVIIQSMKNHFKIPFICFLDILNKNILNIIDYYCILNKNSLYSCIFIISLFFKSLKKLIY